MELMLESEQVWLAEKAKLQGDLKQASEQLAQARVELQDKLDCWEREEGIFQKQMSELQQQLVE